MGSRRPQGGSVTETPRPDGLPRPSDAFEAAVIDFIVDLFTASPVWGTAAGYHAVDSEWPDLTEGGRLARLAMYQRHTDRLSAFPRDALSAEQRLDRRILLEEIEKAVFSDTVLRSEAWDPLDAVYLMGSGLFGVLSREYAPWAQRGAALLARIEGLPAAVPRGPGRIDRPRWSPRRAAPAGHRAGAAGRYRRAGRGDRLRSHCSRGCRRSDRPGRAAQRPPRPRRPQPSKGSGSRSIPTCEPEPPVKAVWAPSCSPGSCATRWVARSRPRSCGNVPGLTITRCVVRCCAWHVRHGRSGCRTSPCRRWPTTTSTARRSW